MESVESVWSLYGHVKHCKYCSRDSGCMTTNTTMAVTNGVVESERGPRSKGESLKSTVWQDKQDTTTNRKYLGRDPAGPLALLGGPSPSSQMVTSTSPIPKPPTESPTESPTEPHLKPTGKSPFKSSPIYVHRPPTILICP